MVDYNVNVQNNLDLNKHELQNAIIQNLSTNPTGIAGLFIYNTTDNRLAYYNGTSWLEVADMTTVSGKVTANSAITPSTSGAVKVTYDAKGLVTGYATPAVADFPFIKTTLDDTSNSEVPTSKAVGDYVANKVAGAYKVKGSATCAQINGTAPSGNITSPTVGDVYNMSDAGTITNTGKTSFSVAIGDNIVWTGNGTNDVGWDKLGATAVVSYPVTDVQAPSGTSVLSGTVAILGSAATKTAGTSAGNVPVLDSNGKLTQDTTGLASGLSATLGVGSGGTGTTSLTQNGVLYGNGTSAVGVTSGSTAGVLIASGSSAPSFGTASVGVGGTGATTFTAGALLAGNGTSAIAPVSQPTGVSATKPIYIDSTGVPKVVTGIDISLIPTGTSASTVPKLAGTITNGQVLQYSSSAGGFVGVANGTVNKYSGTITGDGTTVSFTLAHGLGAVPLVNITDSSGNVVLVHTQVSSTNIIVTFGTAPANGTTYNVYAVA